MLTHKLNLVKVSNAEMDDMIQPVTDFKITLQVILA